MLMKKLQQFSFFGFLYFVYKSYRMKVKYFTEFSHKQSVSAKMEEELCSLYLLLKK